MSTKSSDDEVKQILSCTDPVALFDSWLTMARDHQGIYEPTAMTLATSNRDGQPSARVVLLKDVRNGHFHFFTNYLSRKGQELTINPQACLNFFWDPLARQVRISGKVEELSAELSDEYWKSRPRDSQLSQAISRQSQPLPQGLVLAEEVQKARTQWEGQEVPRPERWGGYRVIPQEIEFWIGRPNRLHDRFVFSHSTSDQWKVQQLYP